MNKALSAFWVLIALGWSIAVDHVARMAGGVEYIVHVGAGVPAALNVLIAAVFLAGTIYLLAGRRLPLPLIVVAVTLTAIHLLGGVGAYAGYTANWRANEPRPELLIAFLRFAQIVRTNTALPWAPLGNFAFLLLPIASAIAIAFALILRPGLPPNDHGAKASGPK
ncbi:MAG: hypothetical protein ACREUW_06040 [Burkholderiales bacterium]